MPGSIGLHRSQPRGTVDTSSAKCQEQRWLDDGQRPSSVGNLARSSGRTAPRRGIGPGMLPGRRGAAGARAVDFTVSLSTRFQRFVEVMTPGQAVQCEVFDPDARVRKQFRLMAGDRRGVRESARGQVRQESSQVFVSGGNSGAVGPPAVGRPTAGPAHRRPGRCRAGARWLQAPARPPPGVARPGSPRPPSGGAAPGGPYAHRQFPFGDEVVANNTTSAA